jgi:hypothetical protein
MKSGVKSGVRSRAGSVRAGSGLTFDIAPSFREERGQALHLTLRHHLGRAGSGLTFDIAPSFSKASIDKYVSINLK